MVVNIQDLKISSPAFETGERMADRFANSNDNDQPPLRISGVPSGTAELAVICHDPDAPLPHGSTHWLLYGIPPETTQIDENQGDERFRPGKSAFGTTGYGGPRPPAGHGPHHYYFWVYALDTPVDGTPSRAKFLDQYGDNIIEQNRLVGVYENP